ncbi:MAG: CGGC domain-containing protein [Tissierellaceae bacterium]|nr:CGGC domain-containing protein [Tissierellaceae bacterium]
MKIAIGVCEKINGRCSSMGCFKAYNNKDKHFLRYKDTDTELQAFFSCNICSSDSKENITTIATRLKDAGVEIIHLGACAVKCKADKLSEIIEVFTSMDMDVVEGTH